MTAFTFRPARRENTPLVIGLAGPTKSGKTYSAHRLAAGLADGRPIAMINAEGAKGHQYTDHFTYLAADLEAPYRPERYTEALKTALALDPRPAVVIIDSLSQIRSSSGGSRSGASGSRSRRSSRCCSRPTRKACRTWRSRTCGSRSTG